MDRIEKVTGTLGKLSKDPALYDRTSQALEKFASSSNRSTRAQGPWASLYKDPSLYDNLNQSTAELTKLIYDLRQDPEEISDNSFPLF